MNTPSRVRVGYRNFAIVDLDEKSENLGEFDDFAGLIRLCAGMQPDHRAQVLIHEILHAAWGMAGIAEGADEEAVVTALARQLAQVIADNPEVVAFVQSELAA